MTIQEAVQKGYELVKASPFEVGIIKNGQGLRTFWLAEFGGKMPTLAHPQIQAAIAIQEDLEKEWNEHANKNENNGR